MKFISSNLMALGGLFSALSAAILLTGGMIGIGTFAAPMLAGFCTLVVLLYADERTAILEWLAAGLLCLILSADKELAVIYLTVFGGYPILKRHLDQCSGAFLRYFLKFAAFNAETVLTYLALLAILYGFDWSSSGYGSTLATFVYLLMGNLIFFLYDRALSMFQRRFTRHIKHTK